MEKQEEWRPVVGYEDFYEVSDFGRVKSLNYRNTGKEGILKPRPEQKRYCRVSLSKDGKEEKHYVHILVWEAFNGKRECDWKHWQVDHIDGDPMNNRLDNIRFGSTKDNHSNPITVQRHAEAMQKLAQDPEWIAKHDKAMEKLWKDEQFRTRHADAMRKVYQDPERRKNHADAMKKLAQDHEWQKNNAEGAKKRAKDPEWRKNHAEAMRRTKSKPVNQYTLEGEYIKTWENATDAARELGISKCHISSCCHGKRKTAGGFFFQLAQ